MTTIQYDLLGRKTQMSDPDMGTWSYTYDAVGNLARQTDARGQVICYYYDAPHRQSSKVYDTPAASALRRATNARNALILPVATTPGSPSKFTPALSARPSTALSTIFSPTICAPNSAILVFLLFCLPKRKS